MEKADKNVRRRTTILRCDLEKDVAHEQHMGFDKKIQVKIRGLSNSLSHWVKCSMTGFHTRHCRCEGVSRDSGCGHKESHFMHDT